MTTRSYHIVPATETGGGYLCKNLSCPVPMPPMVFTHMALLVWLNDALLGGLATTNGGTLRIACIVVDLEEEEVTQ